MDIIKSSINISDLNINMTEEENSEAVKKLLENLQSYLKNISLETKKKHPSVKESSEEAIVKIRNANSSSTNTPLAYLSNQILYPLVQVMYFILFYYDFFK